MISVVKNTTNSFLMPQPLACLQDWYPLQFYVEFTNSQNKQPKGFLISFSETDHNGFLFTFVESDTEDLSNGIVNLGNLMDQWEMNLFQVDGLNLTASLLYSERIQVYGTI